MKWTEAQLRAINEDGGDILLSAAAGSGKTTVMVERIYRLVKSGCDIESLLVITFTRAAAADMKRKLIKRFSRDASDKNIVNALDGVERANIGTIDSYCSYLLRQHFEAADVDPGFRILDDAEQRQLQSRAIDQALEKAIAAPDEGLVTLMFGREISQLKEIVKKLYDFSRARPDPDAFLDMALDKLPSGECDIWFDGLLKHARNLAYEALTLINKAVELCSRPDGPGIYLPSVKEDAQAIDFLCKMDYDEMLNEAKSFALTKIAALRTDKNDPLAEQRKILAKRVRDIRKSAADCLSKIVDAFPERDSALEDMRLSLPALKALKNLCDSYAGILWELKSERMAMSFNDVARLALKALEKPEVQEYQKSRFEYVFVDEYQDVSDLQEAIISRVVKPGRLFMVGDVKQSIYRFRQAEPTLFIEKYNRFGSTDDGNLIRLNSNFRSRGAIIDFVNDVFSRIMNAPSGEIPYKEDDYLVKGADFSGADAPVEAYILDKSQTPEDFTQSRMVASIVSKLIGKSLTPGSDRIIRPGDIAILARTRDTLNLCDQALGEMSIRSYVDAAEGYLEALEVRIMISLMRAIENRRRDFPLIETLRSPIIGLTSTQLALIRSSFPDDAYCDSFNKYMDLGDELASKLRKIKADFDRWRFLSRAMPLSEWIDLLLNETGFYAYAGALPSGRSRQANLDLLCNYASDFAATKSGGLTGFLDYMNDVESLGGDMSSAHSSEDIGDRVTLMTAHKAKGLEFPVVIAAGLGKSLARGKPNAGELLTHRTMGAGLYYNDESLGTRRECVSRLAIDAACETESLEEEKRVLYVMLTRATDRLILTSEISSREDWEFRRSCPELSVIRPTSYMDMISNSVSDGNVRFFVPGEETNVADENVETLKIDESLRDSAREALTWRYPYEGEAWRPVKLTVTGLARELTGAMQADAIVRRPRFMSNAPTGAQRGTLIHQALSLIDLEALRGLDESALNERLKADVEGLYKKGALSSRVDVSILSRFFRRDIGKRILRSDTVKREWQFNMRMTVKEALGEESDSMIIVQGMIDCCFIESDEWTVIDYKTDEAVNPVPIQYINQVKLYKLALERITGRRVARSYLCFLSSGIETEV